MLRWPLQRLLPSHPSHFLEGPTRIDIHHFQFPRILEVPSNRHPKPFPRRLVLAAPLLWQQGAECRQHDWLELLEDNVLPPRSAGLELELVVFKARKQ